jgi:hypothetical protein
MTRCFKDGSMVGRRTKYPFTKLGTLIWYLKSINNSKSHNYPMLVQVSARNWADKCNLPLI